MEGLLILIMVFVGMLFIITAVRGGSLRENLLDLLGRGGGREGGSW